MRADADQKSAGRRWRQCDRRTHAVRFEQGAHRVSLQMIAARSGRATVASRAGAGDPLEFPAVDYFVMICNNN